MRECHTPMSFPTEKLSLPDRRAEEAGRGTQRLDEDAEMKMAAS